MIKSIKKYEYGHLKIGEEGFEQSHWKACVKLNELHNGKYFDVLHNGIRFKQYVGVIQIENVLIEILPKADKNEPDNNKWQGVLISMLKACGHLKANSHDSANVNKHNLNLLEVYFEIFLREIEKLQRLGLIKKYRKNSGNVKALKGKLDFSDNLKHNLVHKERFYTTHQVYDTNHELHQILSTALNVVSKFTKGTRLSSLNNRIKISFPEVSKINITNKLLDNIMLNRKSSHYNYALELARLILLNYSPDIKGGQEKMLSLLFDMNVLWEEYVLVMLKKWNTEQNLGYIIHGQYSKEFISNHTLRPDVVIENESERIIIDTKWKRPLGSASVQDLRQMYAYCRFWNAEKSMLLYPGDLKKSSKFNLFENKDELEHKCKLGYITVLDSNDTISKTIGQDIFNLINN